MAVKEISEYITFPRTFEKYRWYKPILVFIIGAIIYLILSLILTEKTLWPNSYVEDMKS